MGTLIRKKGKLSRKFNKAGGKHSRKLSMSQGHREKVSKIKKQLRKIKKKYPKLKKELLFSLKSSKKMNLLVKNIYSCSNLTDTKMSIKKETVKQNFDGNRILNLNNLSMYVEEITRHSALCAIEHSEELSETSKPFVKLVCETQVHGLASVLLAECQMCRKQFRLCTSDTVICDNGDNRFDINVRAVWGEMVTGGGCTSLNERMGTLGVGHISGHTFRDIENQVSKWWLDALQQEMVTAAVAEKAHAIETGSYSDGVPAITVVTDAGWSKRSHGHSYNAPGMSLYVLLYSRTSLM